MIGISRVHNSKQLQEALNLHFYTDYVEYQHYNNGERVVDLDKSKLDRYSMLAFTYKGNFYDIPIPLFWQIVLSDSLTNKGVSVEYLFGRNSYYIVQESDNIDEDHCDFNLRTYKEIKKGLPSIQDMLEHLETFGYKTSEINPIVVGNKSDFDFFRDKHYVIKYMEEHRDECISMGSYRHDLNKDKIYTAGDLLAHPDKDYYLNNRNFMEILYDLFFKSDDE